MGAKVKLTMQIHAEANKAAIKGEAKFWGKGKPGVAPAAKKPKTAKDAPAAAKNSQLRVFVKKGGSLEAVAGTRWFAKKGSSLAKKGVVQPALTVRPGDRIFA